MITDNNEMCPKCKERIERIKRGIALKRKQTGYQHGNKKLAKEIEDSILRLASENPYATYQEMALKIGVSHSTIWRVLVLHGFHRTRGRLREKVSSLKPDE